jgi:hypothetical protein
MEPRKDLVVIGVALADARKGPPEIRVGWWHVMPNPSATFADGAHGLIGGRVGGLKPFSRQFVSGGDTLLLKPFEDVSQALHSYSSFASCQYRGR